MTYFQAAVLGAVQGATEFIPVSSTGHLIVVPWILKWDEPGLTFDLAAHVGTLAALVWFFWGDWVAIFSSLARWIVNGGRCDSETARRARIAIWIIVATIPVGVAGVLLDKLVANTLQKSYVLIACTTGLVAFVMLAADVWGRKNRMWGDAKLRDWLGIGFAQALALIPGVSRSGITISAGLAEGLDREGAARCSFLLSAPIIAGAAGVHILKDVAINGMPAHEFRVFLVAAITAAIVGYLCIRFLLNYLRRRGLGVFVWYRVAVAVLILAMLFTRK